MIQIEINLSKLERVWIPKTAKRIGHWRKIKGVKKDTDKRESEFVDLAIKGYTAKGGIMASKYMYGSLERESLCNYLETTKPNAVGKMIHRGIGLTDNEWEKLFETWTEPGTIIKNDRVTSFTLNQRRAPIHCTGEQGIIFSIKNKSGIDISKQSIYPEEEEVLTPIGFSWKVISADILYGNTWGIVGEEV